MRFLILCFCLLSPIAATAQTATTTQLSGTIAVDDSATSDAAIAQRIRSILQELDGYEDVTVAVSSGIVTLRGTTLNTARSNELTGLVARVAGVVAIENEVFETTDVVERLNPAVERFKSRGTQAAAFLPLGLIALAVFILIVLLGFFIARRKQPWDRLAPNAFIADIYRQILRLVFIVGGLVVALDIVGAAALLTGILGAAGIVGLAIGFAVRDTVENFIASIMLSIRQPFRPNDTVEIEGDVGKVIRLTSRATILLSFDGNHIRIPNATVFKSRIVNYTRNAERRFTFALSVASDSDLTQARDLALETLHDLPFVLRTPEAEVWVDSVGESWITLNMAAWIDQTETSIVLARSEAIRLTQTSYDVAGIAAPAPTYRLLHAGHLPETVPAPSTRAQNVQEKNQLPASVENVEAKADKQLEEIVDQERAAEESDLLDAHGTQE